MISRGLWPAQSESVRAKPELAEGRMRSNCCAMAVISPPARVRFVLCYASKFIV